MEECNSPNEARRWCAGSGNRCVFTRLLHGEPSLTSMRLQTLTFAGQEKSRSTPCSPAP